MNQNFVVNLKAKKRLHKIQHKKDIRFNKLKKIIKIGWFLTILMPLVFVLYAYMSKDKFLFTIDRYAPVGTKDYFEIISIAGFILLMFFLVTLIIRTVMLNFTIENTKRRINESLIFDSDIIIYSYQRFLQSSTNDRVEVIIPVTEVLIRYNNHLSKFTFTGRIASTYYYVYGDPSSDKIEEEKEQDFIIFDYFEPSLYTFLKAQAINIITEDNE